MSEYEYRHKHGYAVWDVELTDEEDKLLHEGTNPRLIRPGHLLAATFEAPAVDLTELDSHWRDADD